MAELRDAVELLTTGRAPKKKRISYALYLQFSVLLYLNLAHAYFFMLAIGVIHHEWIPALPTIGYGWSLMVTILMRLTFKDTRFPGIWRNVDWKRM